MHDGLYDGDGNKSRYRYNTNSYRLKDDIIKLNFLLGYRVTVHTEQYTTKKDIVRNMYRITRTGRGLVCRTNHKNGEYIKNPSDIVYCVTVQEQSYIICWKK